MDNNISFLDLKNKISITTQRLLKYYDIGFIFENLDALILLNIPYKHSHETEENYQKNKAIAQETMSIAQNAYVKLLEELKLRELLFANIRISNPDFCSTMKGKVPEEDYTEYLSLMKKNSNAITSLMINLPQIDQRNYWDLYKPEDYVALKLKKKEIVSSIIDSKDSSRISHIEDTFVLSELDSLDVLAMDPYTRNIIALLRNILQERIQKYKDKLSQEPKPQAEGFEI